MIDFLFAPEGLRHLKMVAVSRSIEVAQAGPREPACGSLEHHPLHPALI